MSQLQAAENKYDDMNTVVINEDGILKTIDIYSGEVITSSNLRAITPQQRYVYTVPLASHICDLLREGKSFIEIGRLPNLPPYNVIMRWRHFHPDFAEAIKRAKLDRAELYHDKVLEEADGITTEEEAKIAKPKIDAYKWAAEKNNPEEYGKQKPEQGTTGITFIVHTGLPSETPVTIEATYGKANTYSETRGDNSCSEGDSGADTSADGDDAGA
jgi:hypothetical protein